VDGINLAGNALKRLTLVLGIRLLCLQGMSNYVSICDQAGVQRAGSAAELPRAKEHSLPTSTRHWHSPFHSLLVAGLAVKTDRSRTVDIPFYWSHPAPTEIPRQSEVGR